MGKGNLSFNVYCDNIGQPVSDVQIEIIGKDKKYTLTTNKSGQSDLVSLPCPDKEYSLNPQKEVRPYETYSVVVRKQGLEDVEIEGVEILDGEDSIQQVFMYTDDEEKSIQNVVLIPDHCLWGNYDPKIIVDPFTLEILDSDEVSAKILTNPIVPEYIIVHDGLPTNIQAPNYYVPFPEYIKNVATSEIYSTWPIECLKANIYAILSFTMSRIYSEWYLSKGYKFTITSSTQYDQKFIKDRNIAKSISDVVDSIFTDYIKFGSLQQPFFSQYCDGIKVNNNGWLSQWGSKALADKGMKALDILKNYYGNTISISSAPEVAGMPNSFPGYNLKLGICGEPVQKMQLELNVISSSYPLLPKIQPTDGIYKENTKKTVEVFQKVFNLPVTGIVDFSTWYKISYVYIGVSKMLNGRYEFDNPKMPK